LVANQWRALLVAMVIHAMDHREPFQRGPEPGTVNYGDFPRGSAFA
jgi:hypothetical protein